MDLNQSKFGVWSIVVFLSLLAQIGKIFIDIINVILPQKMFLSPHATIVVNLFIFLISFVLAIIALFKDKLLGKILGLITVVILLVTLLYVYGSAGH